MFLCFSAHPSSSCDIMVLESGFIAEVIFMQHQHFIDKGLGWQFRSESKLHFLVHIPHVLVRQWAHWLLKQESFHSNPHRRWLQLSTLKTVQEVISMLEPHWYFECFPNPITRFEFAGVELKRSATVYTNMSWNNCNRFFSTEKCLYL